MASAVPKALIQAHGRRGVTLVNSVTHRLYVAGPAGAVIRVTDGASRRVAAGMHRLDVELAPGIYTVNCTLGRSFETREVLLDSPQSIELHASFPSFGDRVFRLAPDVLAALSAHTFRPGGQLIALRGPWRDERAALMCDVALHRDGAALPAAKGGFIPDPDGGGLWRWQLFDLAPASHDQDTGGPGMLSLTRAVCADGRSPELGEATHAAIQGGDRHATLERVSHVLPHWGDWTVWAAYPATPQGAPDGAQLPLGYYLRLRLSLPGAAPLIGLQSLSDQIFTALAARSGLPLSKPVLDLLLLSDEADPLLTLAAAHVASITLSAMHWRGLPTLLRQDAPASASGSAELSDDDAQVVMQRFMAWLQRAHERDFDRCPDLVAVRHLFGIGTRVHMRLPPVMLRSLDGLIDATSAAGSAALGTTCDEGVWGERIQISESFAFVQWQPDADYRQLLRSSVEQSLKSVQAMQSVTRMIEQTTAAATETEAVDQVEPLGSKRTSRARRSAGKASAGKASAGRQALRELAWRVASGTVLRETAAAAEALDINAFIKANAAHLRVPASALSRLSSALEGLQLDKDLVSSALHELAERAIQRLEKD